MGITLHSMKNIPYRVNKILGEYQSNVEPPRPNGLKRFEIGKQTVWALNMKNAIRKSKLYPELSIIGD